MTDTSPDQVIAKIKPRLTTFVQGNKELFTERLTDQLKRLSAKLDSPQQEGLRNLSVDKIVEDISESVIEFMIKMLRGLIDPKPRVRCLLCNLPTSSCESLIALLLSPSPQHRSYLCTF
jgi:hypothetical protein